MHAAVRYAATFHDQAGELVDVEDVSAENENKPKVLIQIKQSEGRKLTMVSAGEGKLHKVRDEEPECQRKRCVQWLETGHRES